jgi:antitoxin component YwqK of YwqJK toxin-antitoxin module
MTNGYREGEWTLYYDNGNVESKGNYERGEKVGSWSYYSRSGKLIEKVNHKAEEAVAEESP